jgi:UDP-3-O-[3-hydroxymyristoyl] glucosamine N-acyltransferase
MAAAITVAELARRLGGACEGPGGAEITGLAGLREAGAGDVTFLANPRYAAEAAATAATAVIVSRKFDQPCPAAIIRVDDPDRAFAQAAEIFGPPRPVPSPGVHPTAVIAGDATLGADVRIGPHCVVESGAVIGDRTVLWAACYVGHQASIGCDGVLYPHVSIRERVRIGNRVILHNGTVVGSDGFGYTVDAAGVRTKVPQIGTVEVGDDVEVGANVTIDRARFGVTRIGRGVKIDNLVQIAHNVIIGDHAVLVAQVGISGSTEIGPHAILAGQAGVAGHLKIGAGAVVGAQAGVTKDVPPKAFVSGYPAAPHDKATRLHAHLNRLPQLKEKVADLEKRLARLESRLPPS